MGANFDFLTDEHLQYEDDHELTDEECRQIALLCYPAFDRRVSEAENDGEHVLEFLKELDDIELDRLSAVFDGVKLGASMGIYEIPERMMLFAVCMYGEIAIRHQAREENRTPPINGYVYILRSDSGYWKIGRSKNPANRLETFTVKLPFMVSYEIVIPSNDYIALEKELHERYAYCRVDGEWFDLTDGDILDLKNEFENVAEQFNA